MVFPVETGVASNLIGGLVGSLWNHCVRGDSLRKIVHLSALLVPILAEVTGKAVVLVALSLVTILFVLEEALRLRGRRLPLITSFTLRMSRPEETRSLIRRPIYLALGIILALLLFSRPIAYTSIGITAVADPAAAYVGARYGRTHLTRKKTLEGSLAGLTASVLLASVLVSPFTALAGAAGAMLMELVAIPDDNVTIPMGAGAIMTLTTLPIH